jgi:DNA-binding NtrC family response regulator/tetratricopeptide (TPR) repeat protein
MRGASRRSGEMLRVSVSAFAWNAATVATLRHASLPWNECVEREIVVQATPLATIGEIGVRDRLSLVAQFAAHHAFLQFAGIAATRFDRAEWAVARKRGADCRLVRISAPPADVTEAPPVLSLVHDFAEAAGGVELPVLRQSWGRAESVYLEAITALRRDAAADLRWARSAVYGSVLSPGPERLQSIWRTASGVARSDAIEAIRAMSALDETVKLIVIENEFALQRFGALAAIDPSLVNASGTEGEIAEVVAARLAQRPHVILVRRSADPPSRRVAAIASRLGSGSWVFEDEPADVPPTRWFIASPRLSARASVEERLVAVGDAQSWLESFAQSDSLFSYLERGDVPIVTEGLDGIGEPKRSYIAALALLGIEIERELATRFLGSFFFEQQLEDLALPRVTGVDETHFRFASDEIRRHFAAHIPPSSRPALCRAAAEVCSGQRAAELLIEGGDVEEGIRRLESCRWSSDAELIDAIEHLPQGVLTPRLAGLLANAYVRNGGYRDARRAAVEPHRELILAWAERRAGDYASALKRLEKSPEASFAHAILRCELLRLAGRVEEAETAMDGLSPQSDDERAQAAYERALLDLERGREPEVLPVHDAYLSARLATYVALARNDFDTAERRAEEALSAARTRLEQIDAWLDRIFSAFSAGRWPQTRALALEALTVVEETDGDRAAAGILYTLAFLAADDGHWKTAEEMIRRLRHYYSAMDDAERLFEINLLTAHLEFSRGNFREAQAVAANVLGRDNLLPQIREAAALICDEVSAILGRHDIRSTGRSGNRELDDRHRLLSGGRPIDGFNAALAEWLAGRAPRPAVWSGSEKLKLFRAALRVRDRALAEQLAAELSIDVRLEEPAASPDLEILKIAATTTYPYERDAFGPVRWCFAARNRLNHWSMDGNTEIDPAELDRVMATELDGWIRCSDREVLFIEGSECWTAGARSAVAAIVRMRAENHRLLRITGDGPDVVNPAGTAAHGIVGQSPAIQEVFASIDRVARRDVAVCILGESGTGKELVARAIHRASARRQKTFVAVNCAALPENLIESELFGHMRGAFTGADRDRAGLIETADGGTLFLDEIGEMPLIAQAKLLRFLQDGEFRRVGDVTNRSADVRIISATNRRLETAVEEGRFREDLYYRISGVEIALPALRDRGPDVVLLARHFLAAERTRHHGGASDLSSETEMLLRSYRWPGNVRELQNTVRAAHAMAGERRIIEIEHLPERIRSIAATKTVSGSYQDAVTRFRRDLIEKSLLEANGNQNRAAALLNMSRQALAYQIRELGILVRKAPHSEV